MFANHDRIQIHYPESSLINSKPEWKLREFVVKKTRDLVTDPLSIEDYLRRPLIHRGRWLILGTDTESGQLRQFYLSTTREQFRPLPLRLGIYESGATRPTRLLFRAFEPTVRDRLILSRLVCRLSKTELRDSRIGVFSDDMIVI